MKYKVFYFASALAALFFSLLAYAFLNGASCRYSISLYIPDEERNVFMTCYRGKVVALQTNENEQGRLLSKWRVEARHLRLGSQSVYFVYSRVPVTENLYYDANDRFNEISSGYKFLFYRIHRQENKVYIFQTFPRYYVHEGEIDGVLDIWDG